MGVSGAGSRSDPQAPDNNSKSAGRSPTIGLRAEARAMRLPVIFDGGGRWHCRVPCANTLRSLLRVLPVEQLERAAAAYVASWVTIRPPRSLILPRDAPRDHAPEGRPRCAWA